MENKCDKFCHDCVYMGVVESGYIPMCNYIFMEDKRRPCPPGEGCTVKKIGKYKKAVHRKMARAAQKEKERKAKSKAEWEARLRPVKCPVCGTEFQTVIHNKKYCSESCLRLVRNKQWVEYYERKKKNEDCT